MDNSLSAFISVVGRPNVGKSSFVNSALSHKVSIVSDKPQTTRTKIMGILTKDNTQLVFIDTPGFHKPRNLLGQSMIKAVGDGLSDVDGAVLMVEAVTKFKFDAENLPAAELELIEDLKKRKIPTILGINKIDLLQEKEELLSIISAYADKMDFAAVVPISAKNGDGVGIIVEEALKLAKPSVHYFPDDEFTDQPDRIMVAEIIREKLLRSLDREVPHGIAVDVERFYERDTSSGEPILCVEAAIYCEKESHKGIIIGKGGSMLKKVGTRARTDIEKFFDIKADVKLWVKVKEDWRNKGGIIHSFGLD